VHQTAARITAQRGTIELMGSRPNSLANRITLSLSVRSGQPIIRGTRITVFDVLGLLNGGMSTEEILRDYPELSLSDLRAATEYVLHLNQNIIR
jgi:uncharacterized protein (DUF433 family)